MSSRRASGADAFLPVDRSCRQVTETSSLRRTVPAPGGYAAPTKVLLVEDDEGDAFLVRELLLDAGAEFELARVRSLAEAGPVLPGQFQCVLLDLGLPDAQGLQALRTVLEAAPTIAVLVLTGLSDEHRGTEAVAAGAQDYLVKGTIDGQLLTRAIRYAVERKRADESMRRLYESEAQAAENARLERGLLPQPLVSSHGVDVVARYRPGRHQSLLGGDFYDVVECDDGALFALIGDVAGHGPDEAALGVCLRIAWRTLVLAGADPETILSSMDAVLVSERGSDEVFATVSMVRIDHVRHAARFWLAGHPLPVLLDGDVTQVPDEAAGTALGIIEGATWPGFEVPLGDRNRVILYTDGLIEGYDGPESRAGADGGRRLGEEGMQHILGELMASGLESGPLVDALVGEVQERNGGELTDDVAVLLLAWSDRR
jgi:serine phosphatase RsbU (regulator of sigma subunit)